METWWKIWCCACNIPNWVCNGDETDLTRIDVEGLECHSCGHKQILDEFLLETLHDQDLTADDIDYEIGRKKP